MISLSRVMLSTAFLLPRVAHAAFVCRHAVAFTPDHDV